MSNPLPKTDHAFGVPEEKVFCEKCEVEIDPKRDEDLCDACYDHYYCECGRKLDDGYGGSPGDGFCAKCR